MANFKILRTLLAVVLCAGLIACDGPQEREKAYMERGKALFEEGNYVKARLEFRNALQINPKGIESRFYLANIEQKVGNLRGAYAGFSKLAEENPDYLPAQLELARILFIGGQTGQALAKVKMVLAAEPENARARALNAAIAMRGGSLDDAMSEAQAALKIEPGNAEAAAVVAAVHRSQGRFDEAIKSLDEALSQNPDANNLRLLKIRYFINRKDYEKAEEVYKELIERKPDTLAYRASLAKLLANRKRLDDAEAVLRAAIKAQPKNAKAKLLLVDFLTNHRSATAARRELTAFVDKEPDNRDLLMGLAAFYQKQKEPKQAEAIYRKVIGLDGEGKAGVNARTALIGLNLRQGNKKIADSELEKLLEIDPTNPKGLLIRANRSLEKKDYLKAITDLRLVLRDDPNSKDAMKLLSVAHLRAGNQQLAKETLQKLVRVDSKNTEARLQLAQLMARGREYDEAKSLLEEVLVRKPDSVEALQTKAEIALVQRDFAEAEKVSQQIASVGGATAVSKRLLGLVYFGQGKPEKAIEELRVALQADPKSSRIMSSLGRSYLAAKKTKEGVAYFKDFVAKHPDNASAHQFLGDLSAIDGDLKTADQHFAKAAELTGEPAPVYRRYGRALIKTKHPKEAVDAYKKGLEAAPNDEVLLFELAIAQQLAGDPLAAISTYRKMLENNNALDAAANNLAALIADHQFKDKSALDDAMQLATRFQTSQSPLFLDTLGWVHYRLGNTKEAVDILERAVRSSSSIPALHYHLGMAYLADKQKEKAKEHLQKATAGNPDYTGIEDARAALAKL